MLRWRVPVLAARRGCLIIDADNDCTLHPSISRFRQYEWQKNFLAGRGDDANFFHILWGLLTLDSTLSPMFLSSPTHKPSAYLILWLHVGQFEGTHLKGDISQGWNPPVDLGLGSSCSWRASTVAPGWVAKRIEFQSTGDHYSPDVSPCSWLLNIFFMKSFALRIGSCLSDIQCAQFSLFYLYLSTLPEGGKVAPTLLKSP